MGKKGIKLFFAMLIVALQALGAVAKKIPTKKTSKPVDNNYSCDDLSEVENVIVKFKVGKDSKLNFASFERKYNIKNFKFKQIFREKSFATDSDLQDFYLVNANKELLESSYRRKNLFLAADATINRCEALKGLVEDFNANSNVEYAEPDFKAKISAEVLDTFFNASGSWGQEYNDQWALQKIEAQKAWTITEGSKAIVAVIDTGVDYNHPDLWDNIWVNPEFANDTNHDGKINLDDLDLNHNKHIDANEVIPEAIGIDFANGDYDPFDDQGHGSHIAGIIAASKNNKGIVGVAPQAKILIIKAMNEDGEATYSNLAKAVAYAAKYADVANNSWTGDKDSKAIHKAFITAARKGLISVAAAGNAGSSNPGYPAAYTDAVIGVASSSVNDDKSKFSNYGSYVAIAAPGGGETADDKYAYWQRNILSTVSSQNAYSTSLRDYFMQDDDNSLYLRLAGTSMSTAYVTGTVALLKSLNKSMSYADAKKYIVNYGDTINTGSYGFSKRLNAFNSVYNAKFKSIN